MAKQKFYAVRKGKQPGIYNNWAECEPQVKGFKGAQYKAFTSLEDAQNWLSGTEINFEKPTKPKENIENDSLHIWIDGSFDTKTKRASYGLVAYGLKPNNQPYEESKAFESKFNTSQNVLGELLGAKRAVQLAIENDFDKVHIYYDYAGIEKWATAEWRTNLELTQEYQQYMQKAEAYGLDIQWQKVKAHSGNPNNERADALAKEALGIQTTKKINKQDFLEDLTKSDTQDEPEF